MTAQVLYDSVVLAGQRDGVTRLSAVADVPVDVLVPVDGLPAIERVLKALHASVCMRPAVVVGPAPDVMSASQPIRDVFDRYGATWIEPLGDPASSAIAGIDERQPPLLVTTGDHALLTSEVVDSFCAAADAADFDVVVGLVPFAAVSEAYPESRRTVLKFADGGLCGANLFFVRTAAGKRAFEFWCDLQHDRKRPHRMARRIGLGFLIKYLAGRLVLDDALATLSERAGCRVGAIRLDEPRAAVDVDSIEDWRLAERILRETQSPGNEVKRTQ
ncbi:MAG: nucleotidyltransferase family protein [Gammaproteobacteria bacterium]|nr:nucleotidyltransferase family protein [Gammaproteobacteria bacterium]